MDGIARMVFSFMISVFGGFSSLLIMSMYSFDLAKLGKENEFWSIGTIYI